MIKRFKQAAVQVSGLFLFLVGGYIVPVAKWVQDIIANCNSVQFGVTFMVVVFVIYTFIQNKLKL